MTFGRLRPCRPPRLPPPCRLLPIRFGRRRAAFSLFGYVEDVDRDTVLVVGHERGKDADLTVTIDLGKARPTERAHLTSGTYVVLEVRKGRRGAPQCRFPLRMARLRPWTAEEVEDRLAEGRRLARDLRALFDAGDAGPRPKA